MAYGELGPTHHSIEDLSWLRAIDGLAIVVPADPAQTRAAVRWAATRRRHAILRVGRTKVPSVTPEGDDAFAFGRVDRAARGRGRLTIVATGAMVSRALAAAEALAARGLQARVLNVSTIKPLDEAAIVAAARETGAIVTVEEAMIEGGLGAAVAEVVVRHAPVPMRMLGVNGLRADRHDRVPVRPFRPQRRRHRRGRARTEGAVTMSAARPRRSIRARARPNVWSSTPRARWSARGQAPVSIATPEPGWVRAGRRGDLGERAPRRREALELRRSAERVVSVGLSTQRESCVIWDRRTGEALTPVLSWQDQRTEGAARRCVAAGMAATIRRKSGLPLDPMFSAAKARWLFDRLPRVRRATRRRHLHRHDRRVPAVALRRRSRWSKPATPRARSSSTSSPAQLGRRASRRSSTCRSRRCRASSLRPGLSPPRAASRRCPTASPIGAVLADSHSALFAHGAFAPGPGQGDARHGLFGDGPRRPERVRDGDAGAPGVCLTLAWQLEAPMLAFEGNIRSRRLDAGLGGRACSASRRSELADLAAERRATRSGVHLVPAFGGLGAPWWDADAVGDVTGFSFGVTRGARSPAPRSNSIAHQIADVVDAFRASGAPVERLLVDGGPTRNDQLMQFEADMVGAAGRAHGGGRTVRDGRRASRRPQRRPVHDWRAASLERGGGALRAAPAEPSAPASGEAGRSAVARAPVRHRRARAWPQRRRAKAEETHGDREEPMTRGEARGCAPTSCAARPGR